MSEDKERLPKKAKANMKMILDISKSIVENVDEIDNMIPKKPERSELEKVHDSIKIKQKSLKEQVELLEKWVLYLKDM